MNKKVSSILGIDPGTSATGYALIKIQENKLIAADYGVIKFSKKLSLQKRIEKIYNGITELIELHNPDEASVEKLFFAKNVQSVLSLGEARGVILLALQQNQIPIFEYSPRKVKMAVVGNGNASKKQVKYMVKAILKIDISEDSYDVSDALAIALCHYNKIKSGI